MFEQFYAAGFPAASLRPRGGAVSLPSAVDRVAWTSIHPDVARRCVAEAEAYLGIEWPFLSAVRYMDFRRNGDRKRYETLAFKRRHMLRCLVVAECVECNGRFIDEIINGIFCIAEESTWSSPAHGNMFRRPMEPLPDAGDVVIDLFAAATGGLLSWTAYLLRDELDAASPLIVERIEIEVRRRILDPYLMSNRYGWMGFRDDRPVNNWNPWCNSNCLTCFLLIEELAERRLAGVEKVLRSLDRFVHVYRDLYGGDGGCDEGPSYWNHAGGAFFESLELLDEATGGILVDWRDTLVGEIGRYLYRMNAAGDWFVNFADGDARTEISADLVYRYGTRIGDPRLRTLGLDAFRRNLRLESANRFYGNGDKFLGLNWYSMHRVLRTIFDWSDLSVQADKIPEGGISAKESPLVASVFLPGIQIMTGREREGSTEGFFFAVKGGHNEESHNHNDVGNFVAYLDGSPLLIDAGVGTYTARTFSADRYSIWTMQSSFHNLPDVNGYMQVAGRNRAAMNVRFEDDGRLARFGVEIAAAYPAEAGLLSWNRKVTLERDKSLISILENYEIAEPREIVLNFLTQREVRTIDKSEKSRGFTLLGSEAFPNNALLSFEGPGIENCSLEIESIQIDDARLVLVWGSIIRRLRIRIQAPQVSGIIQSSIRRD